MENSTNKYLEFSKDLHDNLKARVNASVYCRVTNDILVVRVTKDNFKYETAMTHIEDRMDAEGELAIENVTCDILDDLHNRVDRYYFKN